VTKVIAGKPLRSRWKDLLHGSVIDQLIEKSGNIDVYVISSEMEQPVFQESGSLRPHRPYERYLAGLLVVGISAILSALARPYLSPANLVMIFLLGVVTSSYYLGRGPSILVSILSVLLYDFFLVPPFLTFAVSDTEYILTFAGLLLVGLVISQLTADVRDRAEAAQQREADTAALYALSRDLAAAESLDAILHAFLDHVSQTFGREVVIFLPDLLRKGLLEPYTHNPQFQTDENEKAVAVWAYLHGQSAGHGTNTLAAAEARYIPLKTVQGTVGVLGIKPREPARSLEPEQRRLLEAFASQAALAIERAQLAEHARQAQISQETEKLQTALLNSISHDLRTPLVSITGVISSLQAADNPMDEATRQSMLDMAGEEADRLNRLVGNLLNMPRIEAGAMRLALEPVDVQDLIGSALEQLGERNRGRTITVDVPADLPLVRMDFVLMSQVLVNLIDNAIKYSPAEALVEIRANVAGAYLEIEVSDRGVGIPKEDLGRIFEKFYRVQQPDQVSGTGLGLSICKGIVEAHGGFITAENRQGGGTVITLAVPLEAVAERNTPPAVQRRDFVRNGIE
jgi:two-component system sensor histidine kinase KdpD